MGEVLDSGVDGGATRGIRPRQIGAIELQDSRLARYLDPSSRPEILADGLVWPEGPTWDSKRRQLYFSDIPSNRIYQWSREKGLATKLDPAGSNGTTPVDPEVMPGTNGLLYCPADDSLLICDQDSRAIQRMDLSTGVRQSVVGGPEALSLNSPNDLCVSRSGTIYFSDPPYGLRKGNNSPVKRRQTNGVYRVGGTGEPELLSDVMTYPNGIALSPDEKFLYVSQSDQSAPLLRRFRIEVDGRLGEHELWHDMAPHQSADSPGMPDGMAVAEDGTLFATAPGGVVVITPEGNLLGRVHTGRATSNCCFGEDGKTLFITADKCLLRIETRIGASRL